LALETAPFGIRVTLVEPGPFRTDFQGRSMQVVKHRIGAYADTVGARRIQQDKDRGREPGDPVRAADAIIDVVEGPNPPLHLVLGAAALGRARQKLGGPPAIDRRVGEGYRSRPIFRRRDYLMPNRSIR
jgi:NAD(P)-dependent dehydrogenase (short-subunit alcohol dehydrogenase family)